MRRRRDCQRGRFVQRPFYWLQPSPETKLDAAVRASSLRGSPAPCRAHTTANCNTYFHLKPPPARRSFHTLFMKKKRGNSGSNHGTGSCCWRPLGRVWAEEKAQRMDGLLKVTPPEEARASQGLESDCYIRRRTLDPGAARPWKAERESV